MNIHSGISRFAENPLDRLRLRIRSLHQPADLAGHQDSLVTKSTKRNAPKTHLKQHNAIQSKKIDHPAAPVPAPSAIKTPWNIASLCDGPAALSQPEGPKRVFLGLVIS